MLTKMFPSNIYPHCYYDVSWTKGNPPPLPQPQKKNQNQKKHYGQGN